MTTMRVKKKKWIGSKATVRYWEDGLAIYADGTLEEQHGVKTPSKEDNAKDEELGVDKGEGQEQLLELTLFNTKEVTLAYKNLTTLDCCVPSAVSSDSLNNLSDVLRQCAASGIFSNDSNTSTVSSFDSSPENTTVFCEVRYA